METTTFDTNTLSLLLAILGSSFTMVILMYRLYGRLDTKFDTKIDRLDTKIDDRFDRLDTKFDTKIDALDAKFDTKIDAIAGDVADTRERVARIEGHLMAPGSFTTRGLSPGTPDEPRPEDSGPDPDQRQAG